MDEYRKIRRVPLAELFATAILLLVPALSAQQATGSPSTPDVPVISDAPATPVQSTLSVKSMTPTESPLVRAARKTKSSKSGKIKSRVSINDAAVKKSKGKLVQISSTNQHKLPAVTGNEVAQLKADQEERTKSAARGSERVEKARADVSDLEKELARLEEEYYSSDDPTSRDQIIEPRFNKTKAQLAKARAELSAARDSAETGSSTAKPGN